MAHSKNWWITFSVTRHMRDGVASQLVGPCAAHPAVCRLSAQRLFDSWMEPAPWFSIEAQHPTMEIELSSGLELYERLAKAQVRILTPTIWGTDGETYSLEFGSGLNIVSFRWFLELPAEWESLRPIASRMEALGEQCISAA